MENSKIILRVRESLAGDSDYWPCRDYIYHLKGGDKLPLIEAGWIWDGSTCSFSKVFFSEEVVELSSQIPDNRFLMAGLTVEIETGSRKWMIRTRSLRFRAKIDLANDTFEYDAMDEDVSQLLIKVDVGGGKEFTLAAIAMCSYVLKHIHDTMEVTPEKKTELCKARVTYGKGIEPKVFKPVYADAGETVVYDMNPDGNIF